MHIVSSMTRSWTQWTADVFQNHRKRVIALLSSVAAAGIIVCVGLSLLIVYHQHGDGNVQSQREGQLL